MNLSKNSHTGNVVCDVWEVATFIPPRAKPSLFSFQWGSFCSSELHGLRKAGWCLFNYDLFLIV